MALRRRCKLTETQYLNNEGSRWRNLPGDRVRVFLDGVDIGTRAVDFYSAFGNFAAYHVRVKGKRYSALPRDFDRDAKGFAIVDLGSTPMRELLIAPSGTWRAMRLRMWNTGRRDLMGKAIIRYRLEDRPASTWYTLFEGDDLHCSPMHAPNSDESVRALLGFLTLKPGDTDADYFDGYTDRQLAWAKSLECEMLATYADEDGPPLSELVKLNPSESGGRADIR